FPLAVCLSGIYDITRVGWGEAGDAVYFNNPVAYVAGLSGDHLEWLRSRVSLLLTVGRGAWEGSTGALEQTPVRGAPCREGHPARARRLGRGHAARLARLARSDRSSSAALCLTRT